MKSVTCENCPKTVRDTPDELIDWIDVGWHGGYKNNACSPACARAIVDVMEKEAKG